MSRAGEVTIGSLRLVAEEAWTFYEFENLILARTHTRYGTLQISTAYRADVKTKDLPTECEKIISQWLGVTDTVGQFRREQTDATIFGMADLPGSSGRAWYNLVGGQLLVAVYQCREPIVTATVEVERNEAESIVRPAEWIENNNAG